MSGPAVERPVRIGLVCPYSFDVSGGVQNHVLGLAAWLRSDGHHVQVLAPGRVPPELHRRYGCPEVTSAGPAWAVPYNGSVARVALAPTAGARVDRWLERGGLDLVHLHEPLIPSASVVALRRSQVPVVATFHTATPRSRTMQLAGRAMARPLGRIGAAIAVSEAARRVVVEHLGLDPTVIGNGFSSPAQLGPTQPVSDGWCPARTEEGLGPRLAFLGRLDEHRKGLDVLVRAWPAIRTRWPQAQVVLAGAGSARLPQGWTSLGRVSDDERSRLLQWCDVFLAPHRGRESFGLVLLEALAAGAQVVAADLPAFVDVVSDDAGPQAHLFGRGDPADLVRALAVALSEQEDGHRQRQRRRVAEICARFDWSVVGPQVLQVYRGTLARAVATPYGAAPPEATLPVPSP